MLELTSIIFAFLYLVAQSTNQVVRSVTSPNGPASRLSTVVRGWNARKLGNTSKRVSNIHHTRATVKGILKRTALGCLGLGRGGSLSLLGWVWVETVNALASPRAGWIATRWRRSGRNLGRRIRLGWSVDWRSGNRWRGMWFRSKN